MLAERENLLDKVKQKQVLLFEISCVEPKFLDKIDSALSNILLNRKYPHLKIPLSYVLREFITNANKANLKRVYFKQNDLYINLPEDYQKGSIGFKQTLHSDLNSLEIMLDDYQQYVKVMFKEYADDNFSVFVINSSTLTKEEINNINTKVQKYKNFKQNGEHYFGNENEETAEGAGLGLFLTFQILEQVGIKSSSLKIGTNEGRTIAKLSFKYSEVTPPPYSDFAKEILSQITTLPKFPANIKAILAKLLQPDVTVKDIANQVSSDPSLSADVLKLVNSAQFALTRKIESITEALNYLGIKGMKGILYSYGAMKILSQRFGTVEEIWKHSYETAAYAGKICKIANLKQNEDSIFTAGLLHDIGKIILMGIDKEKAKIIEDVCSKKGIELPIVEEIMMGLSHALIGGKIAEHWEFPKILVHAISYHHEPLMAKENTSVIYTVYLANHIALNKGLDDLNYSLIENEVKDFFELREPEDLKNLYHKIKIS